MGVGCSHGEAAQITVPPRDPAPPRLQPPAQLFDEAERASLHQGGYRVGDGLVGGGGHHGVARFGVLK